MGFFNQARTYRSLSFVGLRKDGRTFFLWIFLVEQERPRISQFFCTTCLRPLKPGLYEVTRMLDSSSRLNSMT